MSAGRFHVELAEVPDSAVPPLERLIAAAFQELDADVPESATALGASWIVATDQVALGLVPDNATALGARLIAGTDHVAAADVPESANVPARARLATVHVAEADGQSRVIAAVTDLRIDPERRRSRNWARVTYRNRFPNFDAAGTNAPGR